MKYATVVFPIIATLSAAPAMAQEEADDLSGVHVALIAGWDRVTIDDGFDDYSDSGVAYGVSAGYDADLGGIVLGIEGEVSDSTAGSSVTSVDVPGDKFEIDAGIDLYVGARLGFKPSAGSIFYLKGGYTTGRVEIEYDDTTEVFTEGENLGGYRIGGGFETDLGGFLGRVEYRYSDYGSFQYQDFNTGVTTNRHQVVVGLGKKF